MGDKKATPISVNGKDYILEELSEEQQTMVQHIQVSEQRLNQAKFDADNANVTRESFINMLTQQLENPVEDEDEAELAEIVEEIN